MSDPNVGVEPEVAAQPRPVLPVALALRQYKVVYTNWQAAEVAHEAADEAAWKAYTLVERLKRDLTNAETDVRRALQAEVDA